MTTVTPLEVQTPAEIDEQLSKIWAKIAQARQAIARYSKPMHPWREEYVRETAQRLDLKARSEIALGALRLEATPFETEFARRGGWQRAFYCTAHGGHVHRTMDCSTCRWDTSFTWQTWLSGKSEQEIIAEIGMTACTVCYPDAPVAQLTTAERKAIAQADKDVANAAKLVRKRAKELAKVPRAHAEALKVDEFVNTFGLDVSADHAAYRSTWDGGQFSKGYSNAYTTYSDMVTRRARARS